MYQLARVHIHTHTHRYITPFPLRIVVVYDDCDDIGIFYEEALPKVRPLNRTHSQEYPLWSFYFAYLLTFENAPKIVALQQDPEIADKVLLRKQLASCVSAP